MELILREKRKEVGNILSFFFEPKIALKWQAGQYLNLTMPGVPPATADRLFTIASAPHERLLQFTTIIGKSSFKKALSNLHPGDVITADQLGGDFVWQDDGHKKLFIAGGIGVTPYLSIIRDRLRNNQPLNATLLYAGKDEKRPFTPELKAATKKDPSLTLKIYSDTKLTLPQLKKDIPDIKNHIVYLAGSQKFSEDLGEGLVASGFPRTQIKYDYFDGYVDIEY